jgi:hypothetical protein
VSDDKIFAQGLIAKQPHQNAPDFVKVNLSVKVSEFVEYLNQHQVDGWCNIQVKESKAGKWYAEKDNFTPSKKEEYQTGSRQAAAPLRETPAPAPAEDFIDDDLPF